MKFLRLERGALLNLDEIRTIDKYVYFHKGYQMDDGVTRKVQAEITVTTQSGIQPVVRVIATAPSTEGEEWGFGVERCEAINRRIKDILDTMVVLLIDKMNDEHEKIIDIDPRFLAEAMQEEVNRG